MLAVVIPPGYYGLMDGALQGPTLEDQFAGVARELNPISQNESHHLGGFLRLVESHIPVLPQLHVNMIIVPDSTTTM